MGVTHLDPDATDEDILELDRAGCAASGSTFGAAPPTCSPHDAGPARVRAGRLARRVLLDATLLLSLEPVFAKLPAVSIDHLGMSTRGLRYLLNLVDRGAKVKATGFGRTRSTTSATSSGRSTPSIRRR